MYSIRSAQAEENGSNLKVNIPRPPTTSPSAASLSRFPLNRNDSSESEDLLLDVASFLDEDEEANSTDGIAWKSHLANPFRTNSPFGNRSRASSRAPSPCPPPTTIVHHVSIPLTPNHNPEFLAMATLGVHSSQPFGTPKQTNLKQTSPLIGENRFDSKPDSRLAAAQTGNPIPIIFPSTPKLDSAPRDTPILIIEDNPPATISNRDVPIWNAPYPPPAFDLSTPAPEFPSLRKNSAGSILSCTRRRSSTTSLGSVSTTRESYKGEARRSSLGSLFSDKIGEGLALKSGQKRKGSRKSNELNWNKELQQKDLIGQLIQVQNTWFEVVGYAY